MFYFYYCPEIVCAIIRRASENQGWLGLVHYLSTDIFNFMKGLQFIMKYLNQFLRFAADPFFKGKVLTVTGIREWLDHATKAKLGWIVDTVITADATEYKHKAGEAASNLYEKLALKTPVKPTVSVGESVMPVNPVCTVYGEYRNQLSVRCDDVVVAPAAAGKDKV